jgi:carboxyl-terminal processing protease
VRTVPGADRDYKIGIIDVPSFYQDSDARASGDKNYRSTTRDVARLIGELKTEGIDGLVIDLRGNGGGLLTEATGLVGLFVKRGPVVQLRQTGNKLEVLDDPDPEAIWDGPMAVLVDRTSASASEIFSAALQDYGRAIVVGQTTYGKGTVQNLYQLDRFALGPNAGFGELTVTIGKYYRITGDSVQNRGVVPEIDLPSVISTTEVGESTRDSALPWDRIKAVQFDADHTLAGTVPVLQKRHEERLRDDPDLVALASEVQSVDAIRNQKTVSLNLTKRKAEREQQDKDRLALVNARRAAHKEPALESLEKLDPTQEPDANLDESAHIVADLLSLGSTPPTQLSHNVQPGEAPARR